MLQNTFPPLCHRYPNGTLFSTIPYDFRLGPAVWLDTAKEPPGGFFYEHGNFRRLQTLIEGKCALHGRRVILGSISMGGTFVKLFLESVSQEWKDANVIG